MPSILDLLPASIRYNNPGAQYPGPSARAYGSDNTGVIGGGHLIAGFPDPTSGAAAQFDLMRRKYTGKPLAEAIREWSDNPGSEYTNQVTKDTGLNPNSILTMDTLANPDTGVPLAKSMARFEAGREFPLSDEGWQNAHTASVATREPAGLPVQARDLTAGDPNPDGAAIPQNARLASGSVPPGIPTPGSPQQDQGFLSNLGGFLGNNAGELLAIGGGFLNGKPGEGFERAALVRTAQNRQGSTDDLKEYAYARSQGYQGSFQEWQTKVKKGVGSNFGLSPFVTDDGRAFQLSQSGDIKEITDKEGNSLKANKGVDFKDMGTHYQGVNKLTGQPEGPIYPKNNYQAAMEKGEGAKTGEGLGTQYKTIVEDSASARKTKSALGRMRQLSDAAYEGKSAPALQAIRSSLATFGLDPGKVPEGEELTALSNKMVLDASGGSLGTGFSNADRDFIVEQFPTLSQTKPGRARIIDFLEKMADRKIEVLKEANAYRKNNRGSMDGFEEHIAGWSEANPLFPQTAAPVQQAPPPSGAPAAPSGVVKWGRDNNGRPVRLQQ